MKVSEYMEADKNFEAMVSGAVDLYQKIKDLGKKYSLVDFVIGMLYGSFVTQSIYKSEGFDFNKFEAYVKDKAGRL